MRWQHATALSTEPGVGEARAADSAGQRYGSGALAKHPCDEHTVGSGELQWLLLNWLIL